jgi:hypothetical protein
VGNCKVCRGYRRTVLQALAFSLDIRLFIIHNGYLYFNAPSIFVHLRVVCRRILIPSYEAVAVNKNVSSRSINLVHVISGISSLQAALLLFVRELFTEYSVGLCSDKTCCSLNEHSTLIHKKNRSCVGIIISCICCLGLPVTDCDCIYGSRFCQLLVVTLPKLGKFITSSRHIKCLTYRLIVYDVSQDFALRITLPSRHIMQWRI